MRDHRDLNLPKIAKYGILAMLVADGAGIYLAQHKLSQPWSGPRSALPVAPVAQADPSQSLTKDAMELPHLAIGADIAPLPATRSFEARPAVLDLTPIKPEPVADVPVAAAPVVRHVALRAERPAIVPSVRIATLRPISNHSHAFTSAFAHDISSPAQPGSSLPDVDFAHVRAAREADQQASSALGETRLDAPQTLADRPDALAQEQAVEPAAPPSSTGDTPGSADTQPSAPAPSAGGNAELPAS